MNIEEQQKMMLEDMGDTDTAEESTLPELLGNNLDVYLTSLDAYTYEADPMTRGRGIAESVENTAKRINSLCINYLNTALNLIEKECASNHLMDEKELAYLKTWSAERAKDQFDFQAARTLYKGSLDEMEYPSKIEYMKNHKNKNIKTAPKYSPLRQRTLAHCLVDGIAPKPSTGFNIFYGQDIGDKDMDQKNNEKQHTRY